ncbi:MAG: HD domain-containing protein [Candidatus Pacearchaeota archaeon]
MKIEDRVYGEEEIEEEVLIDLINCKSVQRLRGLAQYGFPDEYYPKCGFSRYEHSLGVLISLRKLGADLTEQIAGLLHDVSHTSFSHVIDWAIGNPEKEDFQDKNHLNVIKNSEIPQILNRYGFDYKVVSRIEDFHLLEKEAPILCVDRVDYTLREIVFDGDADLSKKFLFNLKNSNNDLFFVGRDIADEFGRAYAKLNREHWAGVEARARYYLLADILKRSFERGIITEKDIYKTDYELIDQLYEFGTSDMIKDLTFLKRKKVAVSCNNGNGILMRKKYRRVDPQISEDGRLKRLSEVSEDYRLFLENEKSFLEEAKYIKFLK